MLRLALKAARELGAFTAPQFARLARISEPKARQLLDNLVAGGLLKAVEVAGVRFYYRDPVEAADVILSSVDLGKLSPEDRRRLTHL
ncbi:MAG: Fis family transcriptional regulator [Pyrobaculum sp.]